METSDGRIKRLPEHVANKIAAGEVVERPASVVKELIENSLDAGAHSITVSTAGGGSKLVSVKDDGCGMTKNDALMSLERQATSKISDVEDIEKIATLGFRGEAVPSIASVSRFTLTTRVKGSDEAVRIQVDAGRISDISPAGAPEGTHIEVKDLFCNIPARKKFLRSAATEEAHIRGVFTRHSIVRHDVGFFLVSEGRPVHSLPRAASTEERLADLFGRDFTDSLVSMHCEHDGIKVSGFIEKPNLYTPTRHEQYIFVNSRPASAPSIHYAIKEAYPRKQGDVKPAAVIFIELPPSQVDVNVHPAKREVRFRNNQAVKTALTRAIANALSEPFSEGKTFPPPDFGAKYAAVQTAAAESPAAVQPKPTAAEPNPPAADFPQTDLGFPPPGTDLPQAPDPSCIRRQAIQTSLPLAAEEGTRAKPWQWFKFLAATDSGYILVETDSGIVIINPHAARERIAFENLMHESVSSQRLLIPETARFSPLDAARISNSLETIRKAGFQIEEFGPCTFKIDAVPQLVSSLSPAGILSTIAVDLAENRSERAGGWKEECVARSVARSFAGSEIKMTPESAVKLVEDLCACRMPYICPRGRPVMIFTSRSELTRKFNRS